MQARSSICSYLMKNRPPLFVCEIGPEKKNVIFIRFHGLFVIFLRLDGYAIPPISCSLMKPLQLGLEKLDFRLRLRNLKTTVQQRRWNFAAIIINLPKKKQNQIRTNYPPSFCFYWKSISKQSPLGPGQIINMT